MVNSKKKTMKPNNKIISQKSSKQKKIFNHYSKRIMKGGTHDVKQILNTIINIIKDYENNKSEPLSNLFGNDNPSNFIDYLYNTPDSMGGVTPNLAEKTEVEKDRIFAKKAVSTKINWNDPQEMGDIKTIMDRLAEGKSIEIEEGGTPSEPPVICTATAAYDFVPQDQHEDIGLIEGDKIEVWVKDQRGNGWWTGKNVRTQSTGIFPGSYVKDCENNDPEA